MKNSAKRAALLACVIFMGSALSGCGNSNQTETKVTTTTTTDEGKAIETTVVETKDGKDTVVTTSTESADDGGRVDAVIRGADGEEISIQSQKGADGGDVHIKGPGGLVINASGGKSGDSKVEIKGLGSFNLKTDDNGKDVDIETPFAKIKTKGND